MTREEYNEYVAAFRNGMAGLDYPSSGPCPGCEDCGLADHPDMDCPEYEIAGEPFFSWSRCECCARPEGGNRSPAHAWLDGRIIHLDICDDCVYYLEYGKLDDSTMLEIEESENA
jgi:hypothetical protein